MEARDLGDTITFYLPQGSSGAQPFVVFQDRAQVGGFASRAESLGFARDRARDIRRTREVPVRLRVEDENGLWETVDALADP